MTTSTIKAIIFDLDGTLYDETEHFYFLADCIERKLPQDQQLIFRRDYNLAVKFEHPLQIGRVYDLENDLIIVQQDEIVIEAFQWDGQPVSKDIIAKLYPQGKISFHNDWFLNVGDLWWVPMSIAAHYGQDRQLTYEAFLETREYMMSDSFKMKPIPRLQELLREIHEDVYIALLTNSPEQDSEIILQKLGIQHYFHRKIFNGNKPIATTKWFQEIKEELRIDYSEMLSVGDNWINDIKPVSALGCRTIYIDNHQLGNATSVNYVVHKLEEAFPIIETLI